ncbi:MAG: hypothetical protein HYZ32_02405 [Hydrocarboniphaga effusa]|nr:hypothetical protein [Hydrocarboniphaga effusa]
MHTKCRHPTQPVMRCAHCGDELGAHNVRPRLGPSASREYMAALERAAGRRIFGP